MNPPSKRRFRLKQFADADAGATAILDKIDTVLAGHSGVTAEELDFIMNYDIKYRLVRSAGGEEDA